VRQDVEVRPRPVPAIGSVDWGSTGARACFSSFFFNFPCGPSAVFVEGIPKRLMWSRLEADGPEGEEIVVVGRLGKPTGRGGRLGRVGI
jgi:hypothetical protein